MIAEAFALLRVRPLMSLGLLSLPLGLMNVITYFLEAQGPVELSLFSSIAVSIAFCYIFLLVTAVLLFDSGASGQSSQALNRAAATKFIWYFLFGIIVGFAVAVAVAVPLVVILGLAAASLAEPLSSLSEAWFFDLESGGTTFVQTNLAWASLAAETKRSVYATIAITVLIGVLVANLIATIWFVVPVRMVAHNQGLGALGASAKITGKAYGSVYVVSLVSLLVNTAFLLLPFWLIRSGQIADSALNSGFAGIVQGIGSAFGLALVVAAWCRLDGRSP